MNETGENVANSSLIKIIGFGNIFMGDDGIGSLIADHIKKKTLLISP